MPRPRAHELALSICAPTERLVLHAIALHRECSVEHLPAGLVAGVRSALLTGMRPLLEEMARLLEPELFGPPRPPPIADLLEPAAPPPVPLAAGGASAHDQHQRHQAPVHVGPQGVERSARTRVPETGGPRWHAGQSSPGTSGGDVSPSQRPTAPPSGPPPEGWEDEVTPMEETGYEVEYAFEDTRPGFKRVPLQRRPTRQVTDPLAHVPTGRTLRSTPPPPPDVLSSRLRRRT